MGGTKVEAPEPIDHYKARYDDFKARLDLYPELVAAEKKWRPVNDQIFLDSFNRLTGGSGANVLETYRDTLSPMLQSAEDSAREQRARSDLGLLQNYGADTRTALLETDPEQKALSDLLLASAKEDLEGGGFSERDRMDLAEDIRSAQAARGLGGGPSDAAIEGLLNSEYRQALEDRARQAAGHAIGVRSQIGGDAGQVLLGRPVQTQYLQGVAPSLQGRASQDLFPAETNFGQNITMKNYQGQLDANIATAQNKAGLWGSLIQGAGTILGGAAGGPSGLGGLFKG